jgi:hypothetical protein
MKPSLYIPHWIADNGNYAINSLKHDSEDNDGGNVPILIELKGPSPCPSEGAAAVGPDIRSGSGSGSGSFCNTDGPQLELSAPSFRNCAADRPNINMNTNIDFLYQVGEQLSFLANSMLFLCSFFPRIKQPNL